MPEAEETINRLPLMDEIVQSIKESGGFEKELSDQEVSEIMSEIIKTMAAENDRVSASLLSIKVAIGKVKDEVVGRVEGAVRISSPIQANLNINFELGNDKDPKRLKLNSFNMQKNASMGANIALNAAGVERKARRALSNPNQTLGSALDSQLRIRGLTLTDLGLHFTENNTLSVSLKGQSLSAGQMAA